MPTVVDGTCVCQSPNTPVNCVYEYDACDASCVKRLTVTTAAEHGGVACPTDPELSCAPYEDDYDACCPGGEVWDVDAQSCLPPMVDCVFEYDACDSNCKKGVIVTTPAEHGGQACPVDMEDCTPGESPDDACCEYDEFWDSYAGCTLEIVGCMDPNALNVNHNANVAENGQCQYPITGCAVYGARNYESAVTPGYEDNSLCIYDCVGEYGACAADCQKHFDVSVYPANGGTPCPESWASCHPDDDDEDACCPDGEVWDNGAQSCAPAYSANDISDISAFVSGVDSLGFSDAPADHCQGGTATVSFRYQPPTDPAETPDTRSFTAAELEAHVHTLEAGPVELEVVCDFGLGQSASDDFTVTITCGAADVDGDGVCDHNDACAGVQCQAFYAHLPQAGSTIQFAAVGFSHYNINGGTNVNIEICAGTHTVQRTDSGHTLKILNSNGIAGIIEGNADLPIAFVAGEPYNYVCTSHSNMHGDITVVDCASPYTCVDTGSAADDYQCREDPDDANDECGGRGFTGKDCGTCAAGFGWDASTTNPQCVECVAPQHTASLSAGEQCSDVNCDPGQGVLTDFNPAASNNCDVCGAGYYSAGGGASCVLCDFGYTSGVGASGCTNQNECLGSNPCDTNAQCDDTVGSFTCTCKAGYTGDGTSCSNVDECSLGTHTCHTNAECADTDGSHECTCKAGYTGDGKTCTADACVASSVPGKDSDGEIYCVHDGTVTGTTGGCDCGNVRGFSGDGNEKCERADGTPTEKITINGKLFCVDKDPDGKPTVDARDRVRAQHGGNTPAARAPATRKARKEAMRDMMKSARTDVDANLGGDKKKGGQQAFIWLQDYTVKLDEDNDYKEDSATKAKFKALPGSTLKMVVGFEGNSDVVVSARPRKSKKGEAVVVDRVVLATPTSTAVLGIMIDDDGTDAIPTAKFTGKGADNGYDWKCRGDADNWVDPVGGTTKQDGDTVECPIARGEPVARTFDVGSGEEKTTACKQENAENYLGTATYHDQTLCCVVDGCNDPKQLSDAFAAASSGCGDNAGGHTEDVDGNCQTTQCTQAQLFDAYESGSCTRR